MFSGTDGAWYSFDKADPAAGTRVAANLTKILEGKARQVAAGTRLRA